MYVEAHYEQIVYQKEQYNSSFGKQQHYQQSNTR